MKVVEIIKLCKLSLEMLQKSCIKVNDVRYVKMYDEYVELSSFGYKKSYIVAHLSECYGISERKVYYIIRRFGMECKIGAV